MIKVLITAAGLGKRTGLDYPKVIHKYKNVPILIRILKKIYKFDKKPIIVLNPKNQLQISKIIDNYGFKFHKTIQSKPRGMLDAVLTFNQLKNIKYTNLILIWGDLCNPQRGTIDKLLSLHQNDLNDLSIASIKTNFAYTEIIRGKNNSLKKIKENRNKYKSVDNYKPTGSLIYDERTMLDLSDKLKI